ncbi:TRAP transporter small permease [Palleronia aestuarii]|nr:TRAP transporter small permease [Palleronia aestuarii]
MLIALLSLISMVLSVSADAIGRYAFRAPFSGNYEFTSFFAMVALTFMGMPGTYASGGHIRLTIFTPFLDRIPGRLSERINVIFGIVAFGLLAWATGQEAIHKFAVLETTLGAVQFPMYWSYVWVPLGAGLLCLRLLYELVHPQSRASVEVPA